MASEARLFALKSVECLQMYRKLLQLVHLIVIFVVHMTNLRHFAARLLQQQQQLGTEIGRHYSPIRARIRFELVVAVGGRSSESFSIGALRQSVTM